MADVQRRVMLAVGALSNRLYRVSGGRVMGKVRGVPVLLLTVAGRKSGVEHTTAVSYFKDGEGFVVTGSAGGSASEPQWFRNLRHADRAVVEVGPKRMDVTVSVAGADEHKILWEKLIAGAPFFAKYQGKVEREIPMAVLTPVG
ncbi:MAG: nitroreductase/quinone reductase family protein [Actinomycetota bacterium]